MIGVHSDKRVPGPGLPDGENETMAFHAAPRFWLATCGLLLALAVGVAPAGAGDWSQFRRDVYHSGAALEKLRAPLTEIWSVPQELGHSPLYNVSISHGRLYYLSCGGSARAARNLVCADAKTGTVIWRQAMGAAMLKSAYMDTIAPAVNEGGDVFVYDQRGVPQLVAVTITGTKSGTPYQNGFANLDGIGPDQLDAYLVKVEASMAALILQLVAIGDSSLQNGGQPDPRLTGNVPGLRLTGRPLQSISSEFRAAIAGPRQKNGRPMEDTTRVSLSFARKPTLVVQVYRAADGVPGPWLPLPQGWYRRVTRAVTLQHAAPVNPQVVGVALTTDAAAYSFWGPPLLIEDRLVACGAGPQFDWWPYPKPGQRPLVETYVNHAALGTTLEGAPPAPLNGFPPLKTPGGPLVGSDGAGSFLGTLGSLTPGSSWHQETKLSLGIPATANGTGFIGLGGAAADRGIMAFDLAGGAPRWTYAPEGPGGAGVGSANRPGAASPSGHWLHSGLVLQGNLVFGEVNGTVVALEQETGVVRWRHTLPPGTIVRSLVGTPDHLFLCASRTGGSRQPLWEVLGTTDNSLVALRMKDGKEVWSQRVPKPGNLATADGLLYFADGSLHVYGPAERTFRLAVDSPRPPDYGGTEGPLREPRNAPGGEAAPAESDKPAPNARAEPAPAGTLADASILRLRWSDDLEDLVAAVRKRRAATLDLPLLLTLDRMDATRSAWTDGAANPPYTPAWMKSYVAACGQLAAAARPAHFEVLPEINIYLSRHPQELTQVRALLAAVTEAVHTASPDTRVALSFNAELLVGRYSRGDYRPFGDLALPSRIKLAELQELASAADEVGLTSYPQAAFVEPRQIMVDYLLNVRKLFSTRPILVTRAAVQVTTSDVGTFTQGAFMGCLRQNCYFLDASFIAYPDLVAEDAGAGAAAGSLALRVGKDARPGLSVWRDLLSWKHVGIHPLSLEARPEEGPEQ